MNALAVAFSNTRRKPRGFLDKYVRTKLGQQLRIAYDHVATEPLPAEMVALLGKLREVAG